MRTPPTRYVESGPPVSEALQRAAERYAASSPITYAQHVKAPVLIIQGRNDTRTPPRSVEAYEAKMKALGKAIKVHWFDAGHGSLVMDQAIEHHELMLEVRQPYHRRNRVERERVQRAHRAARQRASRGAEPPHNLPHAADALARAADAIR